MSDTLCKLVIHFLLCTRVSTVKPVHNDHLMGYFSAFWSSSRAKGHLDELQKAEIVSKINWFLQPSLKHITD